MRAWKELGITPEAWDKLDREEQLLVLAFLQIESERT